MNLDLSREPLSGVLENQFGWAKILADQSGIALEICDQTINVNQSAYLNEGNKLRYYCISKNTTLINAPHVYYRFGSWLSECCESEYVSLY